ncbi:multidrug and toxin extrusion protein 1 [Chanos chanos]|uniref:Multidrug and toxin extrusion protein n=1 Tax=Chanos chanos TaxID=29144 RepID=A0A6J2VLU1_CHACN|nr:multidrug and toxin extrusion protein 1-like [Chanos chanos]
MTSRQMEEMNLSEISSKCHRHLRCLRSFRNLIPVDFKGEIVQLSILALPVFLSQVMMYSITLVSTGFCGHLGRTELDAVALATTVINVSGITVGFGLASACDTLISQTYGSRNLKRIGVIVQRAILIVLLTCFPCWAILINTQSILLALGQSPEVARLAQTYVKIFMPALPASFMSTVARSYLQNQGCIWPQVITGAVASVLNALINYVFLFVLDLGVPGSAAANSISQFSIMVLLFLYIRWRGLHKDTWGGWSMECLQEWDSYMHLAIPSTLMICADWWLYEIGGFLAGLISDVELGAQSIIYQIANTAYMLPTGFGIAGSVRVGNALGAGQTEQAKMSAKLAMAGAISVATCSSIALGSTKDVIAYVFSNDEQITQRVAKVMVLYAPFHLFDGISGATVNIVRGLGKQKIGAILTLTGFYGFGLPVGVTLMFAAKLGIVGLWTSLLISVILLSVFMSTLLIKLNWEKATAEARVRAGLQTSETEMDGVKQVEGDKASFEVQADTEVLTEEQVGVAVTTVGAPLSCRALILRRGLTLAAMVSILAVGIVVYVLLGG